MTQVLFDNFETLCETPKGVAKLRELVLQFAVQGRLVPQDPHDTPSSVQLEIIAEERAQMVKAGRLRKSEPLPPVEAEEAPYKLPTGWQWTRLGTAGITNPRNEAPDDAEVSFVPMTLIPAAYSVPVTSEKRCWKEIKSGFTHFAENDVVLAKITPCFQNAKSAVMRNLINGVGAGTTELHVFRPLGSTVAPDYVLIYLKSPKFINDGIPRMTGSAGQKRIPHEYFSRNPFPLPPLAEQERIITEVDRMMALCDKLEAQLAQKREGRARLHAASLERLLQARESDEFAACWNRIVDHFDLVHDAPESVGPLRQAVLQLAVQGKLVSQDPKDEPAPVLLENIAHEKAKLVEARKIRKSVPLLPVAADQAPFGLPLNWIWVHIGDVAIIQGGKRLPNGVSFARSVTPYIYIQVTNMKNGTIIRENLKYIDEKTHQLLKRYVIEKDDLYITIAGTIGQPGQVPIEFDGMNLTENAAKLVFRGFDKGYFLLVLKSQLLQEQFVEKTKQLAQPKLALKRIADAVLPLPPLSEQQRIVAKVDALMALCDELEAQLKATQERGARLLAACVGQLSRNTATLSETVDVESADELEEAMV